MQTYQYEVRYPTLTDGIFRLLILFSITFILQVLATIFSLPYFYSLVVVGGEIHWIAFFTHFFVYPISIGGFISFIFEMLLLWSFGSELELLWGTKNFYRYFFISIFGGALMIFLVGFFLPGMIAYSATAGISALLLAYAILFPNRQVLFFFVIPLKMKWVALILFIFLALGSTNHFLLNIGGVISASLYLLYTVKAGRLRQENRHYSTRSSSQVSRIFYDESHEKESPLQRLKNRIEEFKKKRRLEKKRQEILRRIEMKEELDRILEKISKQGMNSLTSEEKKFLDRASKEL
ncbi:MAG: rhomboid family intramembrane serine protease [Leptospiraceae bacterium]|nr:rhomboid family intramembrane serine protease [Leptospiraceae bacterium]MDW7975228.1 rhomboid family intramembrane serine protease [Leptospiraceae bacterium]